MYPPRPDEVRHLLAEITCRNIAGGRIIPFGRQVDILRFIRKQARIALAAGAPADTETLVDRPSALQAGIVGAGDRVTVRRPQLHILDRFEVEVDRGQPIVIVALEPRKGRMEEHKTEL